MPARGYSLRGWQNNQHITKVWVNHRAKTAVQYFSFGDRNQITSHDHGKMTAHMVLKQRLVSLQCCKPGETQRETKANGIRFAVQRVNKRSRRRLTNKTLIEQPPQGPILDITSSAPLRHPSCRYIANVAVTHTMKDSEFHRKLITMNSVVRCS